MFLFIFCSLTPHLNSSSPLGIHTLGGDYLKHLRNVLKSRASSISHTHAHSHPATGFHPPLLTVLHVPFEYPLLSLYIYIGFFSLWVRSNLNFIFKYESLRWYYLWNTMVHFYLKFFLKNVIYKLKVEISTSFN